MGRQWRLAPTRRKRPPYASCRVNNARQMDATNVFSLHALKDYLRQTGRHLVVSEIQRGTCSEC